MKNILKHSILWLLVAVMLCAVLVGCNDEPATNGGDNTDNGSTDSDPQTPGTDAGEPAVKTPMQSDLAGYQIVYADAQIVKSAANNLQTTLKNGGADMKATKKDSAVESNDANLEILVGDTNRGASAAAAAKLTGADEYAILFQGNKVAIVAKAKMNLTDAVDYFVKNYVNAGTLTANDGDCYVGKVSMVQLSDGNTPKFAVVQSVLGTYESAAYEFTQTLQGRLGDNVKVESLTDANPRPTGKNLILIGNNLDAEKYPEIATLAAEWGEFEYGVAKVGEHLLIFGNYSVEDAVKLARAQVSRESETVDGSVWMKLTDDLRKTDDRFLSDYPRFTAKELLRFYYNNNNEIAYEYKGVTTEEYTAYVEALKAADFVPQYGGYQIGRNKFATCVHPEKGQVHITFYPSAKGVGNMTLFVTKLEATAAIPEDTYNPETDQVIPEPIFHVMSQDYTNRGEKIWDGNGLNYIVTLEDGRFVIFDGGYENCSDADNIYKYLKANNKRTDGKVIIAAWFMSHPHDDHFGAFETFMAKGYYREVKIEYFVANAPTAEHYGSEHWMNTTMPGLLKRDNIKLIKPHTGQVLTLCGTKFEIMLSHETQLGYYGGGNDASTVVRIWENGHSILLTMDGMGGVCGTMEALYSVDDLKSDILQLNHHGQSGGTVSFYQKVDPTYALWTTSQDAFSDYKNGRINGGGNCGDDASASNKWIRDNVGIENCYVADDVIEQIRFTEDGEIIIDTETGYFVENRYPTNGDPTVGKLQGPNVEQ